jgi:hypothetical protein
VKARALPSDAPVAASDAPALGAGPSDAREADFAAPFDCVAAILATIAPAADPRVVVTYRHGSVRATLVARGRREVSGHAVTGCAWATAEQLALASLWARVRR